MMRSTRIHILMLVAAVLLVAPGGAVAQFDPPVGTNFDDATVQGWTAAAAIATIGQPGPSGNANDYFMRGGDGSSPPQSILRAPSTFNGDWAAGLDLGGTGRGCVEYDYIVFDDAVTGSSPSVCPSLTLQSDPADLTGIRATFVCNAGKTVTEPSGTDPGWHRYVLPIALATSGGPLPSNAFGTWAIASTLVGATAADDWNTLLAGIQRVNFSADIAGSSNQTEDFGIDNFRVKGCSDFDDQTLQGWTVNAATATTDQPGPSGAATDFFLRGGDQASPPVSAINAAPVHLGNWTDRLELTEIEGGCIEYDYIVFDDAVTGSSADVCPSVTLKEDPTDNVGIRAAFSCDPGATVTEPVGTNPGWHHFVLPLHLAPSGGPLPSNVLGTWVIASSTTDPAADWNTLMGDVQRANFSADIAGSSSQTEDFGIDNFCLKARCDWSPGQPPIPTMTPTPIPTPVPLPCSAKKKICVSKKMCALLKCHETAEKFGMPLNGVCIQKAEDKFDGGAKPEKGCFEKLEANYGASCTTVDDTAALEAKVDAFVTDVVAELDPVFPNPTLNKCSAGKKKCVCKKASGLLKCHAKAEAKGIDPTTDPAILACLQNVHDKFDGGAFPAKGCFAKLEATNDGPCFTTGDTAVIEAKVDAFVEDVVCELDPTVSFCGP